MNTAPAKASSAVAVRRSAGLLIRFAALIYECVLLFGVVFVVAYAVLALKRWTYPLSGLQRLVLQATLFVVLAVYFIYQWSKTGQTLALKAWHLRVIDASGGPPRRAAATLRYLLAWHFLLPGALWVSLFGGRSLIDAGMTAIGVCLLLLPSLFDAERRLLHDRLSGTRIVRER
jgi:uncharacterized RDD family membrane protein YckC